MEETVYTPFEFFNLPDYLQRKIMIEELDFESINNLCEAASRSKSKQAILFNQLCADSEVWRSKFLYTFPSYFEGMDRAAAQHCAIFWRDSYESFGEKAREYEKNFFKAVGKNNLVGVKRSLRLGVDPDIKGDDGESALMIASQRGNLEIVKLLLNLGVDVNTESNTGKTALMGAAMGTNIINGSPEIVRLLLQAGAEVNHRQEKGFTPLIFASIRGNLEIVKLLLEAGAFVDLPTEKGFTALMKASDYGNEEVVRSLLAAGADLNLKTDQGETALMWASGKGHNRIIEQLSLAGADLDTQNNDGNTALLLALIRYEHGADYLPTIFEIIKYKPDPDIMNNIGWTAIELAEELGLDSVVDALMYLKREKRV